MDSAHSRAATNRRVGDAAEWDQDDLELPAGNGVYLENGVARIRTAPLRGGLPRSIQANSPVRVVCIQLAGEGADEPVSVDLKSGFDQLEHLLVTGPPGEIRQRVNIGLASLGQDRAVPRVTVDGAAEVKLLRGATSSARPIVVEQLHLTAGGYFVGQVSAVEASGPGCAEFALPTVAEPFGGYKVTKIFISGEAALRVANSEVGELASNGGRLTLVGGTVDSIIGLSELALRNGPIVRSLAGSSEHPTEVILANEPDNAGATLSVDRVEHASISPNCTLVLSQGGIASSVHFKSGSLQAEPRSRVSATGTVRVESAVDATIEGKIESPLVVEAVGAGGRERPFTRSTLMNVAVTLDGDNSPAVVEAMRDALRVEMSVRAFTPPRWNAKARSPFARSQFVRSASLIHQLDDLAAERARFGTTRTHFRHLALRVRSHEARGLEGRLLRGFRLVGYAQKPGPAFVAWLVAAAVAFVASAMRLRPWGSLSDWATWNRGLELGIGILAAPAGIFRVGDDSLGIPFPAPWLVLTRLGLTILAVAALTAVARTAATKSRFD